MKYYAVKNGRVPGIYDNWTECEQNIKGYAGAVFKAFLSLDQAADYMQQLPKEEENGNLPFAYIDGSFLASAAMYGYGGYIADKGKTHIVQGTGNNADFIQYRNITGEVRGVLEIIKRAVEMGIKEMNIYYDYAGIEQWACGNWACKNALTQYYKAYYDKKAPYIKIHFVHVKGHTGNEGNEIADLLAKDALGVKLTKKQAAALEQFKTAAYC